MKVKKLLSGALALGLAMSMGLTAFAATGDTTVKKIYKLTNANTTSPAETFSFSELKCYKVTNAASDVTVDDVPTPTISSATYAAGEATADGTGTGTEEVTFSIPTDYESVGVYYYYFTETAGSTAGVDYSSQLMALVVTVTNDSTSTSGGFKTNIAIHQATKGNDGTITLGDKVNTITNTYSAGSLKVTKEVTGNFGDKKKAFTVFVTFTKPAGKTVSSTIKYTDGSDGSSVAPGDWGSNGQAIVEVKLKDGQTATFTNIPYGVTYTVKEADYTGDKGGYDAAEYAYTDGTTGKTTKVIDSAEEAATVTNNKGTTPDTGISLDSLPYIMMLAIAGVGLVVFVAKKRSMRED